MRDLDSYPERREGLAQGRLEYERKTPGISSMAVVLGTPDRYREAWLLAGFEPKHNREEKRLEKVRAKVESFDPIKEALDAPDNYLDTILLEVAKGYFKDAVPLMVFYQD